MLRLEALGNHPLIKFGVTTMDKSAHADMMNSQNLMSTRTDLMRTIAEKEELLRSYRAILVSSAKVIENQVMAISVILISLDSSEESVGVFTARVILFGKIPTTIPSTVPTVDSPTIPHIAPTIQYTSSFVCTDSSDSDTPDSSPSQDPYEILLAPPGLPRRQAVLILPGHPILVGRPYHHFTSDDSSLESSPDSSLDSSSEFHLDTSPDSSLRHSSLASSVPRALSPVRFDQLPPHKRIKDYDFVIDPDEAESSARGMIEIGVDRFTHLVVSDDAAEPVRDDYPDLVCADGSLEVMQRGLDMVMQELYDHMVEIQSAAMSAMISTLERDNMRLRGITMLTATHFGMAQAAINKLIAKCVAEALKACGAARNPITKTKWRMSNKTTMSRTMLIMETITMVPNEEDRVEKYIRGLSANIQGNVIAAELIRLHDVIRIATNLMDLKFKGYAENKRRFDNNQETTVDNNNPLRGRMLMVRMWQDLIRSGTMLKGKRIDCKVAVVATTLRSPIGNLTVVTCYECGRQGHYRSECPKLRKQNRGNKKGNNEAKARSYAIGGGGSNPDSNVVTGTFLLNNRYASMLFDSGIDRSFVLTRIGFLAQLMYKKQCKQFAHYMGLFPLTGCATLYILMYPVTEAVVL
nr:hypothetical protein [Tanacetum cinerariifolium]